MKRTELIETAQENEIATIEAKKSVLAFKFDVVKEILSLLDHAREQSLALGEDPEEFEQKIMSLVIAATAKQAETKPAKKRKASPTPPTPLPSDVQFGTPNAVAPEAQIPLVKPATVADPVA